MQVPIQTDTPMRTEAAKRVSEQPGSSTDDSTTCQVTLPAQTFTYDLTHHLACKQTHRQASPNTAIHACLTACTHVLSST